MRNFEKIKLIILDVDGTLTDGGIYYDSQGNEIKRFDVKDGLGIKVAIESGIEFAIITGRESSMVERRAKELGISHVMTGIQKKYPAYLELMAKLKLTSDEIGYIGDDLNDWPVMNEIAYCACPQDAAEQIKDICDFVAEKNGGHGAVRECIEFLLKQQNKWENNVEKLYNVYSIV